MKTVEYIIEVLICSGLFLVLYRWLLAGKVGYRLCRAYIVGTMLLAALIPALDVPLYSPAPEPAAEGTAVLHEFRGNLLPEDGGYGGTTAEDAAATSRKTSAKAIVLKTAAAVYGVTAAASIALIILNIIRIRRLRRGSRLTRMEDWTLAESGKIQTPFSFLRTVYMGFNYSPSERRMILSHEVSHVRHRHSYERLVLSALRSLLWFNPFLWIAEKDLKEVQEWEADRDVLNEGNDLTLYRTAIFKQLFGYNPDISSGLNHSLTKKRFIMMTKTRLGRYAPLRLAAALPLLTATFLAFGCGTKDLTLPPYASGISDPVSGQSAPDDAIQKDSVIHIAITKQDGEYSCTVNGEQRDLGDIGWISNEFVPDSWQSFTIHLELADAVEMGIVTDVTDAIRQFSLKSLTITDHDSDSTAVRTFYIKYDDKSPGPRDLPDVGRR